jgi:hypothetical protein
MARILLLQVGKVMCYLISALPVPEPRGHHISLAKIETLPRHVTGLEGVIGPS